MAFDFYADRRVEVPELQQTLGALVHAARHEVAVGAEAHGVFPARRAAEQRRREARSTQPGEARRQLVAADVDRVLYATFAPDLDVLALG